MVVGVETRGTHCEGKNMNTHMDSPAVGPALSPKQIRLLLLALMGAFFASAAAIPSMGILLRQVTGLLLP